MDYFEKVRKTPKFRVQDSMNELFQYTSLTNIEEVKKLIAEKKFKSLEQYSGLSREELEKYKPGICAQYDSIIPKLQDPDLTIEKLKTINEEVLHILDSLH